jgi:murein DD-endopeptidase MepM/ murein hydrolase activator NlpD
LLSYHSIPLQIFAATERFAESGNVTNTALSFPLTNTSRFAVESSWQEPRTNQLHDGTDSRCTTSDPVYPVADNAYVLEKNTDSSRGNYVILRYYIDSKYVYSAFLHLDRFNNITQGTTISSKSTNVGWCGKTGSATGVHLHWDVAKSYPDYASRIIVNPRYFSWGSTQFNEDAPVFKQFSVTDRTIYISAYNTSLGQKEYVYPKILYKQSSASTWNVASMNLISGYSYSFSIPLTGYVDVLIAGRRTISGTGEYWAYYPPKYTAQVNGDSPVPPLTDNKLTIYFP